MTSAIGKLDVQGVTVAIEEDGPAQVHGLDVCAFALPHMRGYDVMLVLGVGVVALVRGRAYAGAARVADRGTALLRDRSGRQAWLTFAASSPALYAHQAGVQRCSLCRARLRRDAKVSVCGRCRGVLCAGCRPEGAPCIRCARSEEGEVS